MTDPNKEKVLAKWPDAKVSFAFFLGKWVIRASPITGKRIGDGNSEPEAWADAARGLEKGNEMTITEAVKVLREHNAWRRAEEGFSQQSPEAIEEAIDLLCNHVEQEIATNQAKVPK